MLTTIATRVRKPLATTMLLGAALFLEKYFHQHQTSSNV